MKAVEVRELKNRLREYVCEARAGQGVLVTDRGEVVAELGPPGQAAAAPGIPAALSVLAAQGLVTLGHPNDSVLYPDLPPLLTDDGSARLLDAERGDP